MERNFNNEFEKFLKENAEQYRLYPSARVWKGIYSSLHTRRKWYGLGMVLLLITGSLVALLITKSPKDTSITANRATSTTHKTTPANLHASQQTHIGGLNISSNRKVAPPQSLNWDKKSNSGLPEVFVGSISSGTDTDPNQVAGSSESRVFAFNDQLADDDIFGVPNSRHNSEFARPAIAQNPFDWTIESVLNSFSTSIKRNRRVSVQFNFTPTISYRKLSANKAFLNSAATQSATPSTYAPLYDINSVVTHKPDMGLEFGLTTKYTLSSHFKLRAGLQFNINRYDIKAFNYPFEVTKIALRGNAGIDSFYAVSSHRNFSGYKSDWLQNFYFEVSMPVGVEVNLIGDDKVQFGVAGTIQPTYVLGDRAYLLSTDYKNYAEVPWLIRRWNASTSFETYVAYSTGKMKWQVGPQIRYQLLSSFVDKYPVKENLFDFGLKVGVSLNK